jgi:hypothetical protein
MSHYRWENQRHRFTRGGITSDGLLLLTVVSLILSVTAIALTLR